MDYQSFQPGASEQKPILPPAPEIPKKTFTSKFIGLIVLLCALGGAVLAGIWWWQDQQVSKEIVATITPRPELGPIDDWKVYDTGDFTVKIPATLNTVGSKRSGGMESRLYHIGFEVSPFINNYPTNQSVLYSQGKFAEAEQLRYSNCRNSACLSITSSSQIIMDNVQGEEFVLDDSGGGQPAKTSILFHEVIKDNLLYKFYIQESKELPNGLPLPSGLIEAPSSFEIFKKVLSTFKFTAPTSATSNWETFNDTKGRFTIKYPREGLLGVDWNSSVFEQARQRVFGMNGVFGLNRGINENHIPYFSIYAFPPRSTDGVPCQEAAKGYILKYEILGNINISGTVYPKCIITQSMGNKSLHVSFNKNGYTWELVATNYDTYSNLIDPILSTFKFTK